MRPRPMNQSRHTLGGRAVKKFAAGSARVDVTIEGYYQFGEIGMGLARLMAPRTWISRPMPSISTVA